MMDGDSPLISCSDEYRLIKTYCQKRKKSNTSLMQSACYDQFDNVAEKLSQIADSGLIFDEGLEPDSPVAREANSDVIVKLVDLLKKSGDELNETICSNQELLGYLKKTFSYDLFKKLTQTFITSSVPEFLQARKKREQIALTFEVTSRLKALDLHPMNIVMGYGAQYLQENFTPWVKQHGGWEKAFDDDDEEVH
ncbi:apoptosis facilitator Bcl-2-like protein 14 isoform X2 [Puntigrus tetrazona]|uniref:apoptosis facilitator Bcl-2-like protein 14 isoform X2 n=1 Tax=Puntigrus tetrazona TaxID=1606681 RepID=UPI001C890079|nr:apoptosis facilitator Bcl-2-like protein 14 isoform X2 [Puntigrus tetrazona]